MRTVLAPARPSPLAIAVGIAVSCVVTAIAMLALASSAYAPTIEPLPFLDRGWWHAASAALVISLAWRFRHGQEAASYTLLAVSCLLAGWAVEAIRYDIETRAGIKWAVLLISGLALVPAPAAVIAAFASTPPRSLGRHAALILAAVVATSVVAVIAQAAIRERDAAYSGIGQTLVDWFSSSLVILGVLAAAIAGSIRNEAQRVVPAPATPRRRAAVSRPMGYALILAFVMAALTIGAGVQTSAAAEGHTLLPLLAALIAIVGARWSAFVAWSAIAISLGISGVVIFAGALDVEVQKFIQDPEVAWVPTAGWLLMAGCALAVTVTGIAAAAAAAAEAIRPVPAGTSAGTLRVRTIAATATVAGAWATGLWVLGRDVLDLPLLEVPFWAMSMASVVLAVVLVLGAAGVLRARLVPAIAEAEATARRPLRPFRYLETVVVETLTARAAVRRSAVAAERSKLASDLHAQILPSLADIRTRYESGATDADVADRLRELEREVRDLMAERRLVVLEEFGIVEAIEWLVGRAEERAALDIQLSVDDRTTPVRPPREVERAAFRIAQLAVENALQHAAPTRLELQVLARSDEVRVSVVDDGRGFRPTAGARAGDRLGISDMHTQAAEVHGDVQVVSPASGGTMVTFAWPAA
jgi:signal transduction histidine kinase